MYLTWFASFGLLLFIVEIAWYQDLIMQFWEFGKIVKIIKYVVILNIGLNLFNYTEAIVLLYQLWFDIQKDTYSNIANLFYTGLFDLVIGIQLNKRL